MWKRGGQIPCGGALKVAWWMLDSGGLKKSKGRG